MSKAGGDVLAPCPFCAGRALRVKSSGRWGWFVSCSCAAVGPGAGSRDEAVERWNTRAGVEQACLLDLVHGWGDGE